MVPSSNFFYMRKLGATRKPISYEDSPEWEDTDLDVRLEEERGGVCVVWKDLTVSISGKRKYFDKVVKSSSGFAVPGTKIVIMGSARSGKSTLLRAFAGLCREVHEANRLPNFLRVPILLSIASAPRLPLQEQELH
ncbi:ABC transporter G family member 3 [Linum perenne]